MAYVTEQKPADYCNYVGGEWTKSSSGETLPSYNPATGEWVGTAQNSSVSDVEQAIDRAYDVFQKSDWGYNPKRRYEALLGFAQKIEENLERLATVLTREQGKTIKESRQELAGCVDTLKYFAGAARTVFGRSVQLEPGNFGVIAKEPIGVVGIISPWNWPALLMIRELAPALAAGNAVIVKPASLTPVISVELFKLIAEVPQFTKGIVSIITGPGRSIGAAMGVSKKIDMISFTGDTSTGKTIMELATSNIKKLALELGGKSPNVLFADANLDKAIPLIGRSIFISAGQICMAGSRLLVHEAVKDEVLARLKQYAENLCVGNGLLESTDMGPVINQDQLELVTEYCEIGKREGKMITGGHRLSGGEFDRGTFFAPTIIDELSPSCRVVREEIFGPVLAVQSFANEEEALAMANDTDFGLSAGVWTNDLNRAMRMSKGIKAGTVWINTYNKNFPEAEFGGYKQSGLGRTRGVDGLMEYCETKHIHFEVE
ncbi:MULTISPECIES: aldehyde dehydrogenase family protein [Brevibacillus]|uniref:Betaine-aldehyde dehydrogenase n=2 Tax=Brevibacillus TaxID=55080 RepID=A0A1I4DZ66_9BACL|nr:MULTISPECIES: aldehyde dehydrogenase family protein [Brevibacillus]MEC2132056.1 aldehyde dehydrogenase family protein [Brevibacillus centrosporus]MED1954255.1 aldehyde dehydrogenase family protein [Brevibacillus centrosporus]MED4911482.1 aldehyde dehydrogenase family protein [Brevibacillus centrosporus]RNB65833.1 aldehyde dehydrogenase family protein [Brevibacillus centrosporus]RNB85250.1 aldehyde dehydrogenase family protein [Brevibacillus nitrificans]